MGNSATNRCFRLFYDGECPICSREVAWLKRRDLAGNLEIEDIADPAFDPAPYGLNREDIDAVLHGVKPDGLVVRGMEAVREAYRSVGLGWLLAATRLPGLKLIADSVYKYFARNRRSIGRFLGRRCADGQCVVIPKCKDRQSWLPPGGNVV